MSVADALESLSRRSPVSWCGLMSGTSTDGIDAARVSIAIDEGVGRVVSVEGISVPFDGDTARRLRTDLESDRSAEAATRWHQVLGDLFAAAACQLIDRFGDCHGIALSGHTFSHRPGATPPSTLQAGCPVRVAETTGLPVIDGFRRADVAGGGEGAPLVPAGDRLLFAHLGGDLAIVNIGGISNVTWLPAEGDPSARDAGPGNLLLDGVLRRGTGGELPFDAGGEIAAGGCVGEALVERFSRHPFFAGGAPRSCGREEFGDGWIATEEETLVALSLSDRLATICRFIARSIATAVGRCCAGVTPRRLLVGGGGARHRLLMAMIGEEVGIVTEPLEEEKHGVDLDLREAAAFAILGHLYSVGEPGSFPTTTGCKAASPIGSVTLPPSSRAGIAATRSS